MIRTLLAAGLALVAMPAAAATIAATPATLSAAIAAAAPGDTISLAPGSYGPVTIKRSWSRQVTINAGRATVRGLVITGAGVRWRSGTLAAAGGKDGFAGAGYAVRITGARVRLDGVLITDAKKGVVLDGATDVTIADSRFLRLGEDGVIVSRTSGLTIVRNRFAETIGKPTSCAIAMDVVLGLSSRDCLAKGGLWKDGYHPDAIQMRNAVVRFLIEGNIIEGATQGVTQMDTTGDAPLGPGLIWRNRLATSSYHPITIGVSFDVVIRDNSVRRAPGSTVKAIIIPGQARRCGNDVPDEKVQDGACSTAG